MRSFSSLSTNKTAALASLRIPSQVPSICARSIPVPVVRSSNNRLIRRLPILQRRGYHHHHHQQQQQQQQRYLASMSSAAAADAPLPAGRDPCEKVMSGEDGVEVGEEKRKENVGQEASSESQQKDGEKSSEAEAEPVLPPLSAHEFRQYNRLAEHMDYFHEHFRQEWTMLHTAASTGRRPSGMSLKQFLDHGLGFLSQLTTHHGIEETYVFPALARKMPEFQAGSKGGGKGGKGGGNRRAAELLRQHEEIHRGMDGMEAYLRACRNREVELEMAVLRAKMDSWGEVLWKHLDQEVRTLGAENVRKYFTLEEVRRIPM